MTILLTCISAFAQDSQPITFSKNDRVLILAPHPDDEVLGCGGIIQQALRQGIPVHIAFLTNGDSNQWAFLIYRKHPVVMPKAVRGMAQLRRAEALAAAKAMGVDPSHLIFLGYPDFRTINIWFSHWNSRPSARGILTKTRAVPYADALRPGAPYKGEEILADLTTVLKEVHPTKIFLSHPADHNGDHQALYLFSRVAIWDMEKEMEPELYPYLIHFRGWPRPRGSRFINTELLPPAVLTNQAVWKRYNLSQPEIDQKLRALKHHRSQYRSSAGYVASFVRQNEFFGDFPPTKLKAKDDRLIFSVNLSRRLTDDTPGVILYIFGYRSDTPFGSMPKLRVRITPRQYTLYDQRRRLSKNLITVTAEPKKITVEIPLSVLGSPQKIFTGARTFQEKIPMDWAFWRIIELPN